MSKQDEGAIWWPERGYFTATPEQLERLISLGKHQERERIIKLLKEEDLPLMKRHMLAKYDSWESHNIAGQRSGLLMAIALINEGQK